ncbi:MAG TPA: hypothetical protein VGI20_02490 [Rhizomicrobium sp.]|jgi:hypothetical protein
MHPDLAGLRRVHTALAYSLLVLLLPAPALACACGCGVFGVGTLPLLPGNEGGTAFFEYDFMDQNRNWSGTSPAPASQNADKDLRTSFFTAGAQYMWSGGWGAMVEMPFWDRSLTTAETPSDIDTFKHSTLGDIRLMGVYSGFSPDQSSGIVFGAKLPTGDSTFRGFDRDTEIGSGSTDLLLGAYHAGAITPDNAWGWFAEAIGQHAVAERGDYRPGDEVDAAVGIEYAKGFAVGTAAFMPSLQLVDSFRLHDSGAAAAPPNSGYERLFAAPGAEIDVDAWKIYGAVELPVYQRFNGNQLAASALVKFTVGYQF